MHGSVKSLGAGCIEKDMRPENLEILADLLVRSGCGKNHLHNLEPEDLCALTLEAETMVKISLADTDWHPGKPGTGN